jgi:hypothetical protein
MPMPGINLAPARYLCEETGAMIIGADTAALEAFPGDEEGYAPVHCYMFATTGTPIIEVVNLEALAAESVSEFAFIGMRPAAARGDRITAEAHRNSDQHVGRYRRPGSAGTSSRGAPARPRRRRPVARRTPPTPAREGHCRVRFCTVSEEITDHKIVQDLQHVDDRDGDGAWRGERQDDARKCETQPPAENTTGRRSGN